MPHLRLIRGVRTGAGEGGKLRRAGSFELFFRFLGKTTYDVSCYGDRDGTIFANPIGGVPPYQFSLDNNEYVGSSTLIGLTAGDYNVFLKGIFS